MVDVSSANFTMIDAGLVDDYRIQIQPVVPGGGKSFFHEVKERRILKFEDMKTFKVGAVELHYSEA